MSMRSSWYGSHPIWLSANAIFSVGKRDSVSENTQSQSDPAALCELSDIVVASGASALVVGIVEDEPMCMDTVVSVSMHACHSTSHAPLYSDGNPSLDGFSENASA